MQDSNCECKMMDFESVVKEATGFVSNATRGFSITKVDKLNAQIHFKSLDQGHTFYVSCPNSDNILWNVWSDCENSQQALQYVMDSSDLDSTTTISALLEIVAKHLKLAPQIQTETEKAVSSSENKTEKAEDNDGDDSSLDADEEEEEENYYTKEDLDAACDDLKDVQEKEEESRMAAQYFNSSGPEIAVKRLVKDLKSLTNEGSKFGIIASPRDNNLFIWNVKLIDFPTDTKLGQDLVEYARRYKVEPAIHIDMQFPKEYPFEPPFIRVVKPHFKFLTGHVTIGGSICMRLLTKSGWQPTNDIEGILIQVRAEIMSDPKASLDMSKSDQEYTESEAQDAFQRMVKKYGW